MPPLARIALSGLAALAAACAVSPAQSPGAPSLVLDDCLLAAPGLTARVEARCGSFAVPEDRAQPAGRTIDLRVAVVPAVSRSPQPDPLFFLAGGPGQAATESYVSLAFAFDAVSRGRDIVLVDQRGTGGSNPLRCPAGADDPAALTMTEAEALAQRDADLAGCLEALDADPRFYTTPVHAQDLDAVRAALGYHQINLYGVSYGTRAALTYLQMYPDRVRAVILDGVAPQDEPLGLDVARDAQRALDMIFSRCQADAGCSARVPGVRAEFDDLLARLGAEAPVISLAHPLTNQPTELRLTRSGVASAVRLLSYAPETVALLPLLIHTAAQGDYGPLAAQLLVVSEDLERSLSAGLNASVLCAEDAPFIDAAAARQANLGTYLGGLQTDELARLCAIWPRGGLPAGFKQPVRSDVPVLLLSGEADPVTPPENGAQAARTLPNSLHLIAPGQGHNVILRGCLPRLAFEFIDAGRVDGLDTACADTLAPAPFFLDFTGPRP